LYATKSFIRFYDPLAPDPGDATDEEYVDESSWERNG